MHLFHSICLWFSLPLSIWLGSSQVVLSPRRQAGFPERPADRRAMQTRNPGSRL